MIPIHFFCPRPTFLTVYLPPHGLCDVNLVILSQLSELLGILRLYIVYYKLSKICKLEIRKLTMTRGSKNF